VSCASYASDAPDTQNVNGESEYHIDPMFWPDLPLFAPRILTLPGHRHLGPVRVDSVWCPAAVL